jgi:putative sigma-54 modulation protein
MKIEISGDNVEITDAMRAAISEKFGRIHRHFDNLTSAHVVLKLQKLIHSAEGTIHVGGKPNPIHAQADAEDMYTAIDDLMDKLDRQVRRHKSKVTDHHR